HLAIICGEQGCKKPRIECTLGPPCDGEVHALEAVSDHDSQGVLPLNLHLPQSETGPERREIPEEDREFRSPDLGVNGGAGFPPGPLEYRVYTDPFRKKAHAKRCKDETEDISRGCIAGKRIRKESIGPEQFGIIRV